MNSGVAKIEKCWTGFRSKTEIGWRLGPPPGRHTRCSFNTGYPLNETILIIISHRDQRWRSKWEDNNQCINIEFYSLTKCQPASLPHTTVRARTRKYVLALSLRLLRAGWLQMKCLLSTVYYCTIYMPPCPPPCYNITW